MRSRPSLRVLCMLALPLALGLSALALVPSHAAPAKGVPTKEVPAAKPAPANPVPGQVQIQATISVAATRVIDPLDWPHWRGPEQNGISPKRI